MEFWEKVKRFWCLGRNIGDKCIWPDQLANVANYQNRLGEVLKKGGEYIINYQSSRVSPLTSVYLSMGWDRARTRSRGQILSRRSCRTWNMRTCRVQMMTMYVVLVLECTNSLWKCFKSFFCPNVGCNLGSHLDGEPFAIVSVTLSQYFIVHFWCE